MKKKTITLNNKLKAYSVLAGSIVAASSADAQIFYTNVTDYYGFNNGDNYALDLNNDGTDDFTISLTKTVSTSSYYSSSFSFRQISASRQNSNEIAMLSSSYSGAAALNLNDPIDVNNNWGSSNASMAAGFSYYNFGPWVGATDRYLGLKLLVSGNTYYGWARLDVSANSDTYVLKDYAYERTKDKKILAGDMGLTTSITENNINGVSIYSFNKIISINLNNNARSFITVTNVLGQEIKKVEATDKTTQIDMSEANTGIYFVTVNQGDDLLTTTKVYLK